MYVCHHFTESFHLYFKFWKWNYFAGDMLLLVLGSPVPCLFTILFSHNCNFWLLQNLAHAMTAQLSWHAQIFAVILWPRTKGTRWSLNKKNDGILQRTFPKCMIFITKHLNQSYCKVLENLIRNDPLKDNASTGWILSHYTIVVENFLIHTNNIHFQKIKATLKSCQWPLADPWRKTAVTGVVTCTE